MSPSDAHVPATIHLPPGVGAPDSSLVVPGAHVPGTIDLPPGVGAPDSSLTVEIPAAVEQLIASKAAELTPSVTGADEGPTHVYFEPSDGEPPPIYHRRYADCTIFYRETIGAHEVRGQIRDKYERFNGLYRLGPPVTDEWGCPDGIGRYNHFEKRGSIYWHPATGPFMVQGAIRDLWAERGWEQGDLGYPIRDQFAPNTGPPACLFQNGALSSDGNQATDARAARIDREALLTFVWRTFDRIVHESPENIGLYPQRSLDEVSDYGPDLLRARNRSLKITLHGFRDEGLVLPDQKWSAHLQLVLQDVVHEDTFDDADGDGGDDRDDRGSDIVVSHLGNTVDADGVGPGALARRLSAAIADAFPRRVLVPDDPLQPTIPIAADFVGLLVGPNGDVSLYFSDTVPGRVGAHIAQQRIDALVGE